MSEEVKSEEVKVKTKTELLSEMRELQQSYSRAAAELKELTAAEDQKDREARQLDRLEKYRVKYNYYAKADGTAHPIDWDEVEKLIKTSLEQPESKGGYALGFDSTGLEGLGHNFLSGVTFTPMVEEERDARIYAEQEQRRKEYAARAKSK